MRLTSTGLGIGTSSPAYKLDVSGGSGNAYARVTTTGANNWSTLLLENGDGVWHISNDNTGLLQFGRTADPSDQQKLTLDASGNLGLGVTPSAWGVVTGLQVLNANVSSVGGNTNNSNFGSNFYYDGTNFRYIGTSFATNLKQLNGSFEFYTAPSGTAGNAISFTQAMTLDASGRLGIGTTSPSQKLDVNGIIQGTTGLTMLLQ